MSYCFMQHSTVEATRALFAAQTKNNAKTLLDTLLFHNECKKICFTLLDFEMSGVLTKSKCLKISIISVLKLN